MKRTKFIWFILISAVIEIIFWLQAIVKSVTNLTPYILINAFAVIIFGIFIYKLYFFKKDILKWTHIAFGYSMLGSLFNFIYQMIFMAQGKLESLPPEFLKEINTISNDLKISKEAAFELFKNITTTPLIVAFLVVFLLNIIIWILFYKHLKKIKGDSPVASPSPINSESLKQ